MLVREHSRPAAPSQRVFESQADWKRVGRSWHVGSGHGLPILDVWCWHDLPPGVYDFVRLEEFK